MNINWNSAFTILVLSFLAFSCQKSDKHEADSTFQNPGQSTPVQTPTTDETKSPDQVQNPAPAAGTHKDQEVKPEVQAPRIESVSVDINNVILRFMERDFKNYEVDSLLNLTVAYKTRLTFFPTIWKKLSHGEANSEGLKSAKLKIYMAIFKDGFNREQLNLDDVVSSHSFVVTVDKYKVVQDEVMKFRNTASMLSRMTLFLSLQPIEGDMKLEENQMEGMMYPISVGGVQDFFLKKSNWSARNIFELDQARQLVQLKRSGVSLLSQYKQLQGSTVPLHKLNDGILSWVGLQTLKTMQLPLQASVSMLMSGAKMSTKQKAQLEQALCASFFQGTKASAEALLKNSSYQLCVTKPSELYNYGVRWVTSRAGKVRPVPVGFPEIENFSISENISLNSSQNVEQGRSLRAGASGSVSAGANAGLSTPNFFEGLTGVNAGASANMEGRLSLGGEMYAVASSNRSAHSSQSLNISRNNNITAERLQFRLKMPVKKCLVVSLKNQYANTLASLTTRGFYICENKEMVVDRVESYFLLYQNNGQGGSPLSDNLSAQENPLRLLVRGNSRYASMKKMLSGPLSLRLLNSSSVLSQQKQLSFTDLILNQDFPGMISND